MTISHDNMAPLQFNATRESSVKVSALHISPKEMFVNWIPNPEFLETHWCSCPGRQCPDSSSRSTHLIQQLLFPIDASENPVDNSFRCPAQMKGQLVPHIPIYSTLNITCTTVQGDHLCVAPTPCICIFRTAEFHFRTMALRSSQGDSWVEMSKLHNDLRHFLWEEIYSMDVWDTPPPGELFFSSWQLCEYSAILHRSLACGMHSSWLGIKDKKIYDVSYLWC